MKKVFIFFAFISSIAVKTYSQTIIIDKNSQNDSSSITQNFFKIGDFSIAGIQLRGIQEGSFTMGSSECDEIPHTVFIDDFAMMTTEVTVSQFKQFIDETSYQTDADKRTGGFGSSIWDGVKWGEKDSVNWKCGVDGILHPQNEYNHPVVHIGWNDAMAYAHWLCEKTGYNWRLPTEAEWEYAAKGGQNNKYAGSNHIDSVGWYSGNENKTTHPVGQKSPNGFGLFDMTGNVWEFCMDWYDNGYYKNSQTNNPQGPTSGVGYVIRGGCWNTDAPDCRTAVRSYANGDGSSRGNGDGFRLVVVP